MVRDVLFFGLGARHIDRRRPLFAVNNFKCHRIADFEIGVFNAPQFLGMEKQVFGFPFAGNKSKSSFRESFDCSVHFFVEFTHNGKPTIFPFLTYFLNIHHKPVFSKSINMFPN